MAVASDSMIPEAMMTPEELAESEELERQRRTEAFADQLRGKLREATSYRSGTGIETRMTQDLDMYHGTEYKEMSKASPFRERVDRRGDSASRRSRVFVQVTRQKTDSWAAWVEGLLFPTGERNWAIEPTPVPELSRAMNERGGQTMVNPRPGPTQGMPLAHPDEDRPLTVSDVAADHMSLARQKCERMQAEIDDQLTECNYHSECRKVIRSAAKTGTGILKGPIVLNRTRKQWKQVQTADGATVHQMEIVEDERPSSRFVDPWDFFPSPDCGEDVRQAAYIWEREIVPPSELRRLGEVASYDKVAITKCLKEGPNRTNAVRAVDLARRDPEYQSSGHKANNYELWNYVGEVDVEDIRALGMEEQMGLTEEDMLMTRLSAVVVMCNERIIKMAVNPNPDREHYYDVFRCHRIDGSPFGVGIPFIMRYGQLTINAAWRQMQDNAGVSHGPQIVVNRAMIQPSNGDWTIHGMKLWELTGIVQDVKQAFGVFQIQDNQASLQRIIELTMKFIDEETSLPMLMQGERGTAPDKVGVATLLMNSSSTVLKQVARNWDDDITRPHIRRYYDFNMEYSPREDVKGDYTTKPLGATALVIRDQQKNDAALLAGLMNNPKFEIYINPKRLIQAAIRVTSLPDVAATEEEIKQKEEALKRQPPPMEPAVEVAKIKAQTELQSAQLEAQSEAMNIRMRAAAAMQEDQRTLEQQNLEYRMQLLKYANDRQMQIQQVQAELAKLYVEQRMGQVQENQRAFTDIQRDAQQAANQIAVNDAKPEPTAGAA